MGIRNPHAIALRDPRFRSTRAKSEEERNDQRDQWSRNGKYKAGVEDIIDGDDGLDDHSLEEKLQHGDAIKYRGKKGIVTIPDGPLGQVGITVGGKYALVPDDQVELIENALARMVELSKSPLREMRYFEVTSGVRMPVSAEEQEILDKIDGKPLAKSDLDERGQEVARRMVTRGILNRGRDNDKNIVFTANKVKLSRN